VTFVESRTLQRKPYCKANLAMVGGITPIMKLRALADAFS
jgi:hypothetical protein